jgi:hypothetical protein
MHGRPKSHVGLGLAAWSSGESGPCASAGLRTPGALAAHSPRPVRPRDGTVAHMPAVQLCLAGDKVLPVSTGEASGRHRVGSQGQS